MLKHLLLVTLLASTALAGSLVTFSGADPGAGSWMAHPNSDAAHTAFLAALTSYKVLDFESQTLITPAPASMDLGFGVVYTPRNPDALSGIWNLGDTGFGYNVTPGGSRFLRYSSATAGDLDAVFTFATPIDAFGAYFSGDVSGAADVIFNDGSVVTLSLSNTSWSGGVQFVGFVDAGHAISSITFRGNSTDALGIDDVTFHEAAVPEPATLLLTAPIAVLFVIRRRRNG